VWSVVDWITNPNGKVVGFVGEVFRTIMGIKSWITGLMRTAGYNTLDLLCMYLSGDTIGLAIAAIRGLAKKVLRWVL
jgi:hypothetical protein